MPLRRLSLSREDDPLPGDIRRFLREADQRIARFLRTSVAPGFVTSDYSLIYSYLRRLESGSPLPGLCFCEWGSGFGVVACLAAMLGFDAVGIEIRGELVDASRRLAEDFDVPVEFVRGNFAPRSSGIERSGYAELGLEIEDFDLIFAYPWPHEEYRTAAVFHRHAKPGALLLTYHGGDEVRIRRKVNRSSV